MEQHSQGQAITTSAEIQAAFTVALDSVPSGFRMEVVLESATVSGDAGVSTAMVASAAGARFVVELAPDGAVRAVTGPTDANPVLELFALRLFDLPLRLPAEGAAAGVRWSDTTRAAGTAAGIPVTLEVHGHHEGNPDWAEVDGRLVLPVATTADYVLAGEGERASHWISMTGTGTRHARRLVAPSGLVAFGTRNDTLRATIELPDTGMRIPLTQVRTDTLRRVD